MSNASSRGKGRAGSPAPGPDAPTAAMRTAVLKRAADMGLTGTDARRFGARVPKRLVEQAKRRTGIASTKGLIEFALASVALDDPFPHAFVAARGTLDRDLDIGS